MILYAAPVLLLAALLVWALVFANRRVWRWAPPAPAPTETRDGVSRETVFIPTPSGDRVEGWLYLPRAAAPAPIVLLTPGLGGTKEGPLDVFARAFAAAGYAALSIDFRSFGGSEGLPRHDIDPRAHTSDIQTAAAHIRAHLHHRVDANRLVLWATSFSGMAAACAADAMAAKPAAMILHVPYINRPKQMPKPLQLAGYIALSISETIGDALARLVGLKLPGAYITAYCHPGERAFGASRDCPSRHGQPSPHPFWTLIPKQQRGGWRNLILVRGLRHLASADPLPALARATFPVLVIGAAQDDMIDISDTRAAAATLTHPDSGLAVIDCSHFDPYVAPDLAPNLRAQLSFLHKVLLSDLAAAS